MKILKFVSAIFKNTKNAPLLPPPSTEISKPIIKNEKVKPTMSIDDALKKHLPFQDVKKPQQQHVVVTPKDGVITAPKNATANDMGLESMLGTLRYKGGYWAGENKVTLFYEENTKQLQIYKTDSATDKRHTIVLNNKGEWSILSPFIQK